MFYTTLKLLRENNACSSGLATLIASLPEKHTEAKLIPLSHVLKSNGLKHGLWALRATTKDAGKVAARMAIEFARQSLKNFEKLYPEDKRPRTALEVATDFLDGKATLKECESAAESAWSVRSAAQSAWSVRSAAESAWSGARSAAWSGARSAAWSAARSAESAAESAAWSAAESAAWSAASSAAWSAASSAESVAESAVWSVAESASSARSAARSAAWSAAESAAWSAASSAESAAESAVWSVAESARSAAWSAAESAAEQKQKKIFLKLLSFK